MVNNAEHLDISTVPERIYTMLKSLNNFDRAEVYGIVHSVVAKTDRDNCFISNYYRGKAHIETLLALKSVKHFQAIALIARALFELVVDVKLIDAIPNAVEKIVAFSDLEKLRVAKKNLKYADEHPDAAVHDCEIYKSFLEINEKRIEHEKNVLWPKVKGQVDHWSGRNLADRVSLLKTPFEEIYCLEYPRMSWYCHPGPTGIVNLKSETFNYVAAAQNRLAGRSYIFLLTAIIDEFEIAKVTPTIMQKLKSAELLPFVDDPEHIRQLASV